MHVSAFKWVRDQVGEFRGGQFLRDVDTVVEFGSLDINGGIRGAFPASVSWWGIDVQDGSGVDEVADAADWTPVAPVDCVVCCEVLEHTDKGAQICRSAWRALRHGGLFVGTCAGPERAPHSAIDDAPIRDWEFYRNVDADLLEVWLHSAEFRGFHTDYGRGGHDLYWAAWT